ncbi:hypothetical protein ACLOJK_009889 [Asimina triloba]
MVLRWTAYGGRVDLGPTRAESLTFLLHDVRLATGDEVLQLSLLASQDSDIAANAAAFCLILKIISICWLHLTCLLPLFPSPQNHLPYPRHWGSGAGKMTLMDVLAGRKTCGYIEGDIRISGYPKKQET